MTEKLTDEERERIVNMYDADEPEAKALRIIDHLRYRLGLECEQADLDRARLKEARSDLARANALLRDLTDCRDFGEFLNEHLPRIERFLSGTSDTIPRI